MPKDTFINLPTVKKQHIIESIQNALLEKPLAKLTVSDIIRHTSLPRGSFYQYFEDLEDVFHFLVDYYLHAYESELLSRVKNTQIGIFEYLETSFQSDLEYFRHYPHQKIMAKFFKENHPYATDFDTYMKRKHDFHKSFLNCLDLDDINHLSPERQFRLYRLLTQIKMHHIREVMKVRINETDAFLEYLWFLKLIRQGLKEI